jgi:hypothetical protein
MEINGMIRAVLAIALIIFLPSCRSLMGPETHQVVVPVLPTRVMTDAAARGAPRVVEAEYQSQIPQVTRIDAMANGSGVTFHIHLDPGAGTFYDPHTPGGWQFQVFLDTDLNPLTGYAGFELLTRDSESSLPLGEMVVRHTEGGGGPGGWGDEVGEISARVNPRLIMFSLPTSWVSGDGGLRYTLEMYATVAGGPSGSEPVAAYGRSYTGTSRWHNRAPALASEDAAQRYEASRIP